MRDALLDWGCTVREVPGWRTRGTPNGGSFFNPVSFVAHHDVIAPWTYPPGILIHGRPGLSGPLCQTALERDGTWWMVAAGHANHAGPGGWRGVTGNSRAIGCEANNLGNGQPWPAVQIDAYLTGTAALCDYMGVSASMACYHREWQRGKIDPWGPWGPGSPSPGAWTTSGAHYRAKVQARLNAGRIPDFRSTLEDPMFVIRVENKAGPATLIRSGSPPVPLTSSRAWRQLIKLPNVADVPLPRAAYDRQLEAAQAADG